MLKMTSRELCNYVIEENSPYDYRWLNYVYRTEGAEGLKDIARSTVEGFAPSGASKQLIGRAVTLVYLELKNILQ